MKHASVNQRRWSVFSPAELNRGKYLHEVMLKRKKNENGRPLASKSPHSEPENVLGSYKIIIRGTVPGCTCSPLFLRPYTAVLSERPVLQSTLEL